VLRVEMASTGEVSCFGADKYEAFLKSLLATGFKVHVTSARLRGVPIVICPSNSPIMAWVFIFAF
jgi:hypothetical protein